MKAILTVRDHDSKGDGELLKGNESAAHLRRSKFGVVSFTWSAERPRAQKSRMLGGSSNLQRDEHAECANTDTSDESSAKNVVLVLGAGLDDDTGRKDDARDHDSDAPPGSISQVSVNQRADPGSELENGG